LSGGKRSDRSQDEEVFGFRRRVWGGRLPSPGRIPGDTSFGLASKAWHDESNLTAWERKTQRVRNSGEEKRKLEFRESERRSH
jgi:hypothetical protein